MDAAKSESERRPLLFMTRGIDQPFNTRADRSKIARHLSKQYHRQKRKPLYEKILKPETKVIEYPVPYYHGGQRFAVAPGSAGSKKRRLLLKEEDNDEPVLPLIRSAEESSASRIRESKEREICCSCRHALAEQPRTGLAKDPAISLKRPPNLSHDFRSRSKDLSSCTPPLIARPLGSGGWRCDPFRPLPIPAEGCVPMIIDYFLKQWAPEFDRDYRLSEYSDPHLSIVFPLAMDQGVLLQSLVAMCRVFWLVAQGKAWQEESEYLKHRGRALALVQARLERESVADDATLLAIVCLTSIELLASNRNAVIAHAHGLQLLIDKRRGEREDSITSQYAKASARAHAMVGQYVKRRGASAEFPTSPLLPRSPSYPPPQVLGRLRRPFGPDVCKTLSNLPGGFCELALKGSLSLECINVIESLSRKTEEWSVIRMSADVESELKVVYHLHSLAGKSPTEDFLIYGLISFCNQFPDKFENRNPFFNIALKCFDDGVNAKKNVSGIGHQPWLIWVSVVIAGALDICAEPLTGRHVVLDTLLDECEEAHDWAWLEQSLRNFLWTDKLGNHWRRCWEEGMRRWQGRCRDLPSPSSSCSSSSSSLALSAVPVHPIAGLAQLLRDSYELTEAYRRAQMK